MIGSRLTRAETSKSPAALLTPELTEGPFYIDLERIRRNITEGKPGLPLRMRIKVSDMTGAPIPRAAVDVWHCDSLGVYSGFSAMHGPPPGQGPPPFMDDDDDEFGPPPGGPPGGPGFTPGQTHKPDNNQTFLRGVQLTDASGMARIDSIFPGWYAGRTTHIHVRVHLGGLVADGRYQKGHISHTGQIFFDEQVTNRIYQLPAYAKNKQERMPLREDGIFNQGGSQSLARLTPIDPQRFESGFFSDTLLVVDPSASPPPA